MITKSTRGCFGKPEDSSSGNTTTLQDITKKRKKPPSPVPELMQTPLDTPQVKELKSPQNTSDTPARAIAPKTPDKQEQAEKDRVAQKARRAKKWSAMQSLNEKPDQSPAEQRRFFNYMRRLLGANIRLLSKLSMVWGLLGEIERATAAYSIYMRIAREILTQKSPIRRSFERSLLKEMGRTQPSLMAKILHIQLFHVFIRGQSMFPLNWQSKRSSSPQNTASLQRSCI